MSMSRTRVCSIALCLAVGIALAGCGAGGAAEEATPTPILETATSVKPTYKVQLGTVTDQINFTARIEPVNEEQLYFKTDGRVSNVAVQEGDKVTKGEVLAELEISDLLNQLAQAQVTLQTAQLKLQQAQQDITDQKTQAESAVRQAQLRLDIAKAQDPSPSILIAQANEQKSKAALDAAQHAYDLKAMRPDIAMLPESLNLQQATIDYSIAKAQYDQALQSQQVWQYNVQLAQESVVIAQSNLQKLGSTVDPSLSSDVAKAQLAVDRLQAQIDAGRLVSPLDGEVTMVGVSAGQTTAAYKPVVYVAQLDKLEVSADLVSSQYIQLSVGQPCSLDIANYPSKTFSGTVRRIPSLALNTNIIQEDRTTRVTINDPEPDMERGTLVRVTCTVQSKDNVLWVPPDAVRTYQGKDFVLIQDGDVERRIPVKVGIRTEDRVEIVSGLTEGQIAIGQ
jgi:RND family efflux transporter MFP subunit